MTDVGVRVTVDGAEDAQRKLDGVAHSIENTGKAGEKATSGLDKVTESIKEFSPAADKATSGLDKVTESIKEFSPAADKASSVLESLGVTAGSVGAVLGTALVGALAYAGAKMFDAVQSTTALGDRMSELSQQTGITVEKLSGGLRLAAETSGSSIDGLARGINHLNKQIADAADGNGKAADTFARLGISVHDANGNLKNADEVLREIATAFAGAHDGATKTEAATVLLSRAGVILIPTLNQGAEGLAQLEREAKLAGITMSGETAEAADKLSDNMRILKAYGEGFWQGFASPVVEGLAKVTTAMRDARAAGEGFFASLYEGAKKLVEVSFFSSAQNKLDTNQSRIAEVLTSLAKEQARPNQVAASGNIGRLQKELNTLMQESVRLQGLAGVEAAWDKPAGAAGALLTGQPLTNIAAPNNPKKPSGSNKPTDWEQVASQMVSGEISYMRQLVAAGEMSKQEFADKLDAMSFEYSAFEKARVHAAAEAMKIRSEILLAEEKAMLASDDEVRKQYLASRKEETKALESRQKTAERGAQAELKQINDTTYLFREHKLAALEELRKKYEDMGADGAKALERINGEMDALKGSTKAAGVLIQDTGFDMMTVWKGVHGVLERTISETAKWLLGMESSIHSLGDAIKSFAVGVANTVIQEFSRMAANKVFQWLFGGGGGGTSGTGGGGNGLLGGIFDWLLGSGSGSGSGGGSGGATGGSGGGLLGNLFGGGGDGGGIFSSIGSGVGGLFQDLGVAMGSQGVADIGNFINSAFGDGLGGASPIIGGVMKLLQGDVKGAALSTGLGLIGNAILPGVGGVIGSFVGGLFGGSDKQSSILQGFDIQGFLGPTGFEGTIMAFDQLGNTWDGGQTGAKGVWAELWSQKLPGATITVPVNGKVAASTSGFDFAEGHNLFVSLMDQLAAARYVDGVKQFATGADAVFTSPQAIIVGDTPERVTISPLAGAAHRTGAGGGISITLAGLSLMDDYAVKRMQYTLRRMMP